MYICIYVYMYICIYVYMYICIIYIYVYIYRERVRQIKHPSAPSAKSGVRWRSEAVERCLLVFPDLGFGLSCLGLSVWCLVFEVWVLQSSRLSSGLCQLLYHTKPRRDTLNPKSKDPLP